MTALRRRRAVLTTAVLAAGAAAVLALGWDEIAVAWRAARLHRDPRALARAVFLDPGTIDARAALACLRADELEARFAAEVAGREWRVSAMAGNPHSILPQTRVDASLLLEPSGRGYRVAFERLFGAGRPGTMNEPRFVEVRGPFLIDLETPGRVETWGISGGSLVFPAFARIGERTWLSVWSRRAHDITVHFYDLFELDEEPGAGAKGTCRHARHTSGEPVVGRPHDVLAGSLPVAPFRAEAAEAGTIAVRIATDPETVLLIDPRTGTGWHGSRRPDGWPEGARWDARSP